MSDPGISDPASPSSDHAAAPKNPLDRLPLAEFVKGWRMIVGEPPSIMLDDRSDMIRHLLECEPAAELDLTAPRL